MRIDELSPRHTGSKRRCTRTRANGPLVSPNKTPVEICHLVHIRDNFHRTRRRVPAVSRAIRSLHVNLGTWPAALSTRPGGLCASGRPSLVSACTPSAPSNPTHISHILSTRGAASGEIPLCRDPPIASRDLALGPSRHKGCICTRGRRSKDHRPFQCRRISCTPSSNRPIQKRSQTSEAKPRAKDAGRLGGPIGLTDRLSICP